MRPVLMDNAFEAWAAAIRYCNDIKDGKATLQYQKNFVSSLHNAVELSVKVSPGSALSKKGRTKTSLQTT